MTDVHTWLLAFDVADDRRRDRLSRFLEGRGQRVQWSVFEILETRAGIGRVLDEAIDPSRFDPAADSLRCYRVCAACLGDADVRGLGAPPVAAGRPVVL